MEWDEPGNPRGVVPIKNMSGIGKEVFEIGETCNMRVQNGSKIVNYTTQLLGMGKIFLSNSTVGVSYIMVIVCRNPERDE